MPALIIALIIAVTAATGGTAAFASQDALPGEPLYPVKTAIEQIQVTLAVGEEAKAQAYISLAEKRIAEIEKAVQKRNSVASDSAAKAFVKELTEADQQITGATDSGKDVSRLVARLEENLSRHGKALAAIELNAPAKAKDALAKAAAAAEKGLKNASTRALKEPTSVSTGNNTPTPTASVVATVGLTVTATLTPTATVTATTTSIISSAVLLTLTQTISDVQQLANDSSVSGQSYNGLLAKLRSAEQAIGRSQPDVAERVLDAFMNELNAFRNAGHISDENYNKLRTGYENLLKNLAETQRTRTTGKLEPVSTPPSGRPEELPTPKGKK